MIRRRLVVRVTLPVEALTEEYVARVAAAVESVSPSKGQRVTVEYDGDEKPKKRRRGPV